MRMTSLAGRFAALVIAVLVLTWLPSTGYAVAIAVGAPSAPGSSVVVGVSDSRHMAAVRAAVEREGGIVRRTLRWNAFEVLPPSGTDATQFSAEIRGVSGVRYAQREIILHAYATANDPLFAQQWGLPDIGAPTAWDHTEGAGVSVAVIDTGILSTHPDLAGNVVLYHNYVNPAKDATGDNTLSNDNTDGQFYVSVKTGQFLKISRAEITKVK